jgi:hypothetical protein
MPPVRKFAELDRRFRHHDGGGADLDFEWPGLRDDLSWEDVLKLSRVVILAEAGAGKTSELRARAQKLNGEGSLAVFLTVQELKGSFREALGRRANEVDAWITSDRPAWFFIDSIDEGRWDGVQFETALKKIADGIYGAEARAHIILSGRFHDWDGAVDLIALKEQLPVPTGDVPPAPSRDELLEMALRHQTADSPPEPPNPDVLLLTGLDEARMRRFAEAKELPDIDAFLQAIAEGHHWRFARRPRDFGWMVDFWRDNRRLGTLSEMYQSSLTARLEEDNPTYRKADTLDRTRAWQALESIGAALVFGRAVAVALPSEEIDDAPVGLDLRDILPDWDRADIARLLGRAVFEPGAVGRTRLHNDNEGSVRAYLAARWLKRLAAANVPARAIRELLLATVYELDVVRPSLRAAAAWYAADNRDIGELVAQRDPVALMNFADPASLSIALRRAALANLIAMLIAEPEDYVLFDHDNMRRFADPELEADIRGHWPSGAAAPRVRELLLLLIWRGRLRGCADLALEAARDTASSSTARMMGASAVSELGDETAKTALITEILANPLTATTVTWHAIETFFPANATIEQVFQVVRSVPGEAGHGFRSQGARMAARLHRPDELAEFVAAATIAALADPQSAEEYEVPPDSWRDPITAATLRLMTLSGDRDVPAEALEAVLYLNKARFFHGRPGREHIAMEREFNRTPERRRALFWGVAERMKAEDPSSPPVNTHQLEMKGWPNGLEVTDIPWLLADGLARADDSDARLATSAAMDRWQVDGSSPDALADIQSVAAARPVMAQLITARLTPHTHSPTVQAQLDRMAEHKQAADAERRERTASWEAFIAQVEADPDTLRRPRISPASGKLDRTLYQIWQIASSVAGSSNRFSTSDFGPAAALIGDTLVEALETALMAFWREATPLIKSQRKPDDLDKIYPGDQMGLAGVSVEARRIAGWPRGLQPDDVRKAAAYATLELNGFPRWLEPLAAASPEEVAEPLIVEVRDFLAKQAEQTFGILQNLEHAESAVQRAVVGKLFELVQADPAFPPFHLRSVLSIIAAQRDALGPEIADFMLDRAGTAPDLAAAGAYYGTAFALAPEKALASLQARLKALAPADQTDLAVSLVPKLLGDVFNVRSGGIPLPFAVLEQLIPITFGAIRPDEDNQRHLGEAYTPDPRDHAERARNTVLQRLGDTPGRASYGALKRLAAEGVLPVAPHHLRQMAFDRAWKDAELTKWRAKDVAAFERDGEHAPTTAGELQALAERRIEDIQDTLLTHRFAQGRTFKNLPREEDVQLWVADRLDTTKGDSFTLERETKRVDRKSPDITLQARAADNVSLAIEIKVVDELSIAEIQDALRTQLVGKYLRSSVDRHGMLLLVYQDQRAVGWNGPDGVLDFAGVIALLRADAAAIAGVSDDSPQPVIAFLDVSSVSET